jgi:hypothetical protein
MAFVQGGELMRITHEQQDVFMVLGNLGQLLAAFAAAIALVFTAVTLRSESKRAREDEERRRKDEERARLIHSVDLLMRLDERFNSERGLQIRCAAARVLRKESSNGSRLQKLEPEMVELIDVLNFFEMVGLLTKEGALKVEHVRHKFGAKLRAYYFACEEAILNRREEDHWYYEDLMNLHTEIVKLQNEWYEAHGKPPSKITNAILIGFLEKEIKRGRHVQHAEEGSKPSSNDDLAELVVPEGGGRHWIADAIRSAFSSTLPSR